MINFKMYTRNKRLFWDLNNLSSFLDNQINLKTRELKKSKNKKSIKQEILFLKKIYKDVIKKIEKIKPDLYRN